MAFFDGPKPRQFAHRGSRGTHPENTIVAFKAALEVGAEAFELDVHTSAEGEVVVIHDSTLERTTDGHGKVRDLSLDQLKALDAGHNFTLDDGETFPFRGRELRIPTLAEVLDAFPDVPIIVENGTGTSLPVRRSRYPLTGTGFRFSARLSSGPLTRLIARSLSGL
jgi:glycerophosphoryl diester phosphodiesterase